MASACHVCCSRKAINKELSKKVFWWRFCGLYSSSSAARWKQTSGCRTHFLYWFISKSSSGAGLCPGGRSPPLPSILSCFRNGLRIIFFFFALVNSLHWAEEYPCAQYFLFSKLDPQARGLSAFQDDWGGSDRSPWWKVCRGGTGLRSHRASGVLGSGQSLAALPLTHTLLEAEGKVSGGIAARTPCPFCQVCSPHLGGKGDIGQVGPSFSFATVVFLY